MTCIFCRSYLNRLSYINRAKIHLSFIIKVVCPEVTLAPVKLTESVPNLVGDINVPKIEQSRWTSPRLTIGLTLGLNIAHYSVGYVSPSWIQGFFLDKVQDFL